MENQPKLRNAKQYIDHDLYPLNTFPDDLITKIGGYLTYLIYIGRKDISGSDWGDAFAGSIGGRHLDAPVGIEDVVFGNSCWSMKTVKEKDPFGCTGVRLISGRCSPDYSFGIMNPHEDIQKTGEAVLNIWNERVKIAKRNFDRIRTCVLIRGYDLLNYVLFEEETKTYNPEDYTWKANGNGNFIGMDGSGRICFTWQPHGSQFTIHTDVPQNAVKFSLKKPPVLKVENVLENIRFDGSWISAFDQILFPATLWA